MMICKTNVALVAFCLIFSNVALPASSKDLPPMVKIYKIGAEYVVFDVSGANTLDGLPVKSINVNYTQIPANSSVNTHPSVTVVHSRLGFDRFVNVTNLNAGASYQFQFYVSNTKNEQGPSSQIQVLLKPQTPDFSITHHSANTIRLFWGYPNEKQIDYFLLTVEKVIHSCSLLDQCIQWYIFVLP